jgi:hypothetical protein
MGTKKKIDFECSFCLAKKNQKPETKRQLQFFFRKKSLRNSTKKIVVHTVSPKSTALLPTYAKFDTNNAVL